MKKIKSIYRIFLFFFGMIIASFLILYQHSKTSLKDSLMRVAQIQMEYSSVQLEQKVNEIEIEADGILYSDDLKELQLIVTDEYDIYDYVMSVNQIKENMYRRQKSNVGMSEFILYWPESNRIVTTSSTTAIEKELFKSAEDHTWFTYKKEMYFARKYATDWDQTDDEPYLIIRMERNFLYKIKNMASGMGSGGTLLMLPGGESLFSVDDTESALLSEMARQKRGESAYELGIEQGKYQIVQSSAAKNGLEIITYYPIKEMMRPVGNITSITGKMLIIILLIGFLLMILYYKNILLQLKIITEKLKQVEGGDFTAQIPELPDNEFSYVFEQFNRMVTRISQLISSTLKEQQLRNHAELRQLQLQIHPHFLYNSLSYIVTVADKPEAVTEMAVHLADYYRYSMKNKSSATIGEEVSYAKAYLSIMAMRKRTEYSINVSESLYETPIIPLILQPIIENAIEHAIEERENAKHIYVKIYQLPNGTVRFEISDDGDGMTDSEIEQLMKRLWKKQQDEKESVGLWNVNQRLINYYDDSSGLKFGKSIWGGLLVSFTILPERIADEGINCR